MKILRNAIKCRLCGSIIESKSIHDFQTCKCGSVSVDGGLAYIRRCGNIEDFDELSIFSDEDEKSGLQ